VTCEVVAVAWTNSVAMKDAHATDRLVAEAPCAVIYELDVDPANCDAIVLRALEDTKHLREYVPGFIEARVLAGDEKDRITIYAAWQTRHDWSASQWDPIIGATLGDLHSMAQAVRFKFYSRREVISGPDS
jgi:hypothetical protein